MSGSPGSTAGARRASIPPQIGCCRALWQRIRPPAWPIARGEGSRIALTPSRLKRPPGASSDRNPTGRTLLGPDGSWRRLGCRDACRHGERCLFFPLRCRLAVAGLVPADQVSLMVSAVPTYVTATLVGRSSQSMRPEAMESCGRSPSAVRERYAHRAGSRVAGQNERERLEPLAPLESGAIGARTRASLPPTAGSPLRRCRESVRASHPLRTRRPSGSSCR